MGCPADARNSACCDCPSLFTVLQEQLELKLESQRGPIDVLIIESVDRLSEN
jgi:uncharacterized protein (TIGR03435 family)